MRQRFKMRLAARAETSRRSKVPAQGDSQVSPLEAAARKLLEQGQCAERIAWTLTAKFRRRLESAQAFLARVQESLKPQEQRTNP
jgi:hypothetical protein